jgi:hypothetical protein
MRVPEPHRRPPCRSQDELVANLPGRRIAGLRMHDLRHSYAFMLVNSGLSHASRCRFSLVTWPLEQSFASRPSALRKGRSRDPSCAHAFRSSASALCQWGGRYRRSRLSAGSSSATPRPRLASHPPRKGRRKSGFTCGWFSSLVMNFWKHVASLQSIAGLGEDRRVPDEVVRGEPTKPTIQKMRRSRSRFVMMQHKPQILQRRAGCSLAEIVEFRDENCLAS